MGLRHTSSVPQTHSMFYVYALGTRLARVLPVWPTVDPFWRMCVPIRPLGTRLVHCRPVWRECGPFGALGTLLTHWRPVWRICDPFCPLGTRLARVLPIWHTVDPFGACVTQLAHWGPVWRTGNPFWRECYPIGTLLTRFGACVTRFLDPQNLQVTFYKRAL